MADSRDREPILSRRRVLLAGLFVLGAGLVALAAAFGLSRRDQRFTGSEFAMDTVITVTVYGPRAKVNAETALAEFRRVDELLSAFRPESDIGRVNAAAGRAAVRVSRETIEVVALALKYAALSGGRFDPTVGPLVRLWQIGEGRKEPPAAGEVRAARRLVGYERVMVDEPGRRLYLPERGMALDLGAVAKGYAAGRAAELLKRRGVKSALIDAGGNIVAVGARPDGRPWRIGLRHPRRAGEVSGVLEVTDRAVVTSGDYERYFLFEGRRYHHLLDPETGYPADELQSATVVAGSSALADILSTAVFVLGPKEGPEFARRQGASTVVVDRTGQVLVAPELQNVWSAVPAAAKGENGS